MAKARDHDLSTTERGRALEGLVAYMFEKVPGVSVIAMNAVDVFDCQELDVVLQNDPAADGLFGFGPEILVECKNWADPVGSSEVAWLDTKLRCRGLRHGLLVTMNGVTGKPHSLTSAHNIASIALAEQRRIVVLDAETMSEVATPADLVQLCRNRMARLLTSRGIE